MIGQMPRRGMLRLALAVVALVPAPSACESSLNVACPNAAGCVDGLLVRLDHLPVGAFSVAVSPVPLDQVPSILPVYRYECAGGPAPCLQDIWFAGYLSSTVYVEVTTASGTAVYERTGVRYPWDYPNGKGCGGSCRTGEISVTLTN